MSMAMHIHVPRFFFILVLFSSLFILAEGRSDGSEQELHRWNEFKLKYNKRYDTPEVEEWHLSHFKDNLKLIEEHNSRRERRSTLGTTKFADRPANQTHAGGCSISNITFVKSRTTIETTKPIPSYINWKTKGRVTAVKDQGNCGSCWAFGTTGVIEGYQSQVGQLVSLSEQHLVDCSHTDHNNGCDGGNVISAFIDILSTGIATSASYPYEAKQGKCRFSSAKVGSKIKDFKILTQSETEMKEAVALKGPVSVIIDTFKLGLHESGIFDDPGCFWNYTKPSNDLHSVIVVGYGTENGTPYWLIKNSWGADWGENGYFKMARNQNRCGINTQVTYPIISPQTPVTQDKHPNHGNLGARVNNMLIWLLVLLITKL